MNNTPQARWRLVLSTLATVAIIAAIVTLPAASAQAYVLLGCKWKTGNFTYVNYTTSLYATASNAAISNWNAKTSVNMTSSSGSKLTINKVYRGNDGAAGATAYTCQNNGLFSRADLTVNTFYLTDYSANKKRLVFAHELGHAMGLDHASSKKVVMWKDASSFDDFGIYTVQPDDIAGANHLY